MSLFRPINIRQLEAIYEDEVYVAASSCGSKYKYNIKPVKPLKQIGQYDDNNEHQITPKLKPQHSIHVKDVPKNQRNCTSQRENEIAINHYDVIEKYADYDYINYGKILIDGYIREIGNTLNNNIIPSSIKDLCSNFSYCPDDGIFQLAHTLHGIFKNNRYNKRTQTLSFCFTGIELVLKLKKNIHGFDKLKHKTIMSYCNKLIKSQYIHPIATSYSFGGIYDTLFCYSNRYLYEFNLKQAHLFDGYNSFKQCCDRSAWNIETPVEVYSSSGWQLGQIVGTDSNVVSVVYRNSSNNILLKKTIDRYNFDKIRSTKLFINNRNKWKKGSIIEIYSHSQHRWYKGKIRDITHPTNREISYISKLKIHYKIDNGSVCKKTVCKWSCDVRDIQINSLNVDKNILNKYKSGLAVTIWSQSKQLWVFGHIKVVMPIVRCIIVKYGKYEKIIAMDSEQFKLV